MTAAAQAARIDDPTALLAAYLASRPEGYPAPEPGQTAASFFETAFDKGAAGDGFCTGYYEPELQGAHHRHDDFIHPLYRRPPDLTPDTPYLDRKSINEGALAGRGLELLWLSDPVEAFFLHIQGSGRIRMQDGGIVRVGYAGKNGHPYKSIGRVLVDRGLFSLEEITAQSLKDWLAAHPDDGTRLMDENPSYVFFDIRNDLSDHHGPIGTAGVPLTPMMSVAADPAHHPLGSLLHIQHDPATGLKDGHAIVQDTGGAIRGARRIDLFTGTGDAAGAIASGLKHAVRVTVFMPRKKPI